MVNIVVQRVLAVERLKCKGAKITDMESAGTSGYSGDKLSCFRMCLGELF
jgi:hypothetical protein